MSFSPRRARFAAAALVLGAGDRRQRRRMQPARATQPQQRQRSAPAGKSADLRLGAMPSVVKATAIVNGEVITQTDIDQRLALLAIANGGKIPADEVEAPAPAGAAQPDRRDAADPGREGRQRSGHRHGHRQDGRPRRRQCEADSRRRLADYLKPHGSSIRSHPPPDPGRNRLAPPAAAEDREHGQRRRRRSARPSSSRLNASKGTEEYRVGEIFLSANAATRCSRRHGQRQPDHRAACSQGASFVGYARQFSEASTAAVGGDLGWVRPEQLPEQLGQRDPANGARAGQHADQGSGRLFDHRRAGHPQDPDRRSAQRRAQPEAGLDHLPGGNHHASRPSRSSRASRRRRRTSAAAAAPSSIASEFNGEVVQSATRSSCASFRRRCRK